MKPINSIKLYLPVVTLSFVLVSISFGASAQRNNTNNKDRKEYTYNENSNKGKDSKDFRNERSDYQISRNEWRNPNEKKHDNRKWARNDDDHEYRPSYSKKINRSRPYYYDHPNYGRVYNRFDHDPIIFRHPQGNYYYSGNRFYTYRDRVGYCVVEPPRNVYFSELPFNCKKVLLNGQVFFRNGDLFFQLSRSGYVIVPSPIEIRFSARF